jgi:periplasmic protein CpxP/Spy
MKKMVLVSLTVLVFTVCLGLNSAGAEGWSGHHRGQPGAVGDRMLERLLSLNLTDAQKHSVAVILKQHRDEFRTLAKQTRDARKQLFGQLRADPLSEDAIKQAFHQVSADEEQLVLLRARVFHELKGALTAEQLAKLDECRPKPPEGAKAKTGERVSLADEWIDSHSK